MSCFYHLVTRPLNLAIPRYSFEPRDKMFFKGNGFSSFAKIMGKNISKNSSRKYSQKLMYLKLLQKSHSKNSRSNW